MNTEQRYLLISVQYNNQNDLEMIERIAQEHDCDGIEEFDLNENEIDHILGVEAFTAEGASRENIEHVENFVRKNHAGRLKIYFSSGDFENKAYRFYEKVSPLFSAEIKMENWEDWNSKWRKHFKRIDISKRLSIIPEWEKNKLADIDTPVYIYPGMGFGTGDHETTYLCLKILENFGQYFIDTKKVLDFGCGSGILGIATMKILNLRNCTFCDIDTRALDNCLQNMTLNFNSENLEKVRLISRERFACDSHYELIFANILAPVLKEEANFLISCLPPKGKIIISGLLVEQTKDVLKNYKGLRVLEELGLGGWNAILLEKS